MAESYEIPIFFTEQQSEAYAAWGIKKEKVLLPFAAVTVLIDIAAIIFTAIKVWGIRESDHLMFQILVQSEWIGKIADFLAIGMTVLLLGPINYLLDKIWKKPQDPMWLRITLDKTVVKVSCGSGKADADNVMTEAHPLGKTATFLMLPIMQFIMTVDGGLSEQTQLRVFIRRGNSIPGWIIRIIKQKESAA